MQGIQRGVWTQVNFRNESIDTSGQYFPAISVYKPTVAGEYSLKAQIQIQDVLGYELTETHADRRIRAAIYRNQNKIEENSTVVEHYYPNDPKEDTTVVVETIVNVSEQDIISGNNEFTAHVRVDGVRENIIDGKYSLCGGVSGFDQAAVFNGGTTTAGGGSLSGTSYVELPDLQIGTSDFTIEFWMNPTRKSDMGSYNRHHTILCSGGDTDYTSDSYGDWNLTLNDYEDPAERKIVVTEWQEAGQGTPYNRAVNWLYDWDQGWQHVAVTKEDLGNGYAQYRLFVNGTELLNPTGSSQGGTIGSWELYSLGDGNTPWFIGTRLGVDSGYTSINDWKYRGELDELLITKSVKYNANFTPQSTPHACTPSENCHALYHFDDGVDDALGNYNGTANNLESYVTSQAGFAINPGCTTSSALNYDENATIDDGSCYYYKGCTDPDYKEYWENTNTIDHPDDSMCLTKAVFGCTDEDATNYNEDAQVDDGTCIVLGCTDPNDNEYDANATFDDGSCEGVVS